MLFLIKFSQIPKSHFYDRMEETDHEHDHRREQFPSSSSIDDGPSTSSFLTSQVQEQEEEGINGQSINELTNHSSSGISYRVNLTISNVAANQIIRDDTWPCLLVVLAFWLFASMTLILGCYGSLNLQLGPNSSRIIKTSTWFVQSTQVSREVAGETKPGPMLYGFYELPTLDVETTWTETHKPVIPIDLHQEWLYFLNKGSKVDIFYNIKSPRSARLSLVIAQGKSGLVEWIDDPSYPNSTLSWKIIFGSGEIQQEIFEPSNYYVAVGNFNSEDVEVELKFKIKAVIYNTTQAHYKCSINQHPCQFKLSLFRTSFALLTSPSHVEDSSDDDWNVKISYKPRWILYFVGSAIMSVLVLLTMRYCDVLQASDGNGDIRSERTPLLAPKDDDISSWGSSYDSISNDGDYINEYLAANALEGKLVNLPEDKNLKSLCVICFDASRDCFFLPCGHCAACFVCASRIAEEAGTCPICRRSMKKVKKIFSV